MVSGWTLNQWEDVLTGFTSGATPYRGRPDYYKGTIRWVSSGELNYRLIFDTNEHISLQALSDASLTLHSAGTFLMAITGLEAAGTRGSCALLAEDSTTNQSCMAIYGSDKIDIRYLYHYYVHYGDRLAFQYCQGTKQQSYTAKIVKKLPIYYPESLSEQHHIIEALSDTDALLIAMEKLIAKKRAIKQGAMQELLTGKRRLPGFSGEILEKELEPLCETFCDGDWIEAKDQSEEGIRLIQTGNIGNGKYLDKSDKKRFVSESTFIRLKCTEILPNDILVSRLPDPAGRACLIPAGHEKAITAVDCTIIRPHSYNPVLFVMYSQTAEYQRQINLFLAGSTRQRISRRELGKVKVPYFDQEEQVAIASVLTDMDAEIDKLTTKLEKLRHIKQGMMNELLTGRIRLTDQEQVS